MSRFGLIGAALSHSFSKTYFEKKFEILGLNYTYENFECATIEEVKNLLKQDDSLGYNVTIPYKESIIPLLDGLSDEAAKIGAVNTIKRCGTELIGYNTDVFGFHQMIKPYFKSRHERAIILGTGGASKAVKFVLNHLGCQEIYISRNPEGNQQFNYDEVNSYMLNSHLMIINTTPVGTYPNISEEVHIPYEFISNQHLVIDLIYNPEETVFLRRAKENGAVTLNGLVMLREQAEKSWEIWNNQ